MKKNYLKDKLQDNEKNILKVIEWAHRQNIKVEELSKEEIIEAAKSYIRESNHS